MSQFNLFGEIEKELIIDQDGECLYYPSLLSGENLFQNLAEEINWRDDKITLFGKTHNVPRRHAWYNDHKMSYTYSNISLPVNSFSKTLESIRVEIATKLGIHFNSCLCNLYRDGHDYAAIHADDEKELGENPIIASVSLGATRKFVFKHKFNKGLDKVSLELENRSVLLMKGKLQHFWKHELPRMKRVKEPRINLTFRNLIEN